MIMDMMASTLDDRLWRILYLALRSIIVVSGDNALRVLLSILFSLSFLSIMMAFDIFRSLFFKWIWWQADRKCRDNEVPYLG